MKSKVPIIVCPEAVKVSGGEALAAVLDKRTCLPGIWGARRGPRVDGACGLQHSQGVSLAKIYINIKVQQVVLKVRFRSLQGGPVQAT